MNTNTSMLENKKLSDKTENFIAQTTIRKWGNSQGIRLSKQVLSKMDLEENDTIEICVCDGKMVIEKTKKPQKPKYSNLRERLEAFYEKPLADIYVESAQEVDTGAPTGEEQW